MVKKMVEEEVERAKLQRRWVSVVQAAAVLGLSPAAVRSRIARGHIPAKRVDGRVWIDLEELDRRLDRA
jgi:hypothetical protein